MINEIITELSSALDLYLPYQPSAGLRFFMCLSGHDVANSFRKAIAQCQVQKIVELLLDFAQSNANVGFWDQDKLNDFLWGNHKGGRNGGVYQMLYEFLLNDELGKQIYQNLQTNDKYKAKPRNGPVKEKDLNTEGQKMLKSVQTLTIYLKENLNRPYENSKDLNALGLKVYKGLFTNPDYLKTYTCENIEKLIGYNFAGNHSLRRRI